MFLPAVNSLQRFYASHVLLYHSTYSVVPESLTDGLHNVHPEELYRQVEWLKAHFQIVDVDEFLQKRRPGLAAITFDDGYECVFAEAIPVLEALQVPCTVFINGSSFDGRPFWRDKIRFLINRSLVSQFLDFLTSETDEPWSITEEKFYKLTKDPRINSRRLDEQIDRFLDRNGVAYQELSHCVHNRSVMRPSPLLSVGNHSLNHYVLSSLSPDEQAFEIQRNHEIILSLGLRTSKVFSIPFGGDGDFNDFTLRLIHDLGYSGFLYSRGLLNLFGPRRSKSEAGPLPSAERYMVPPRFGAFQRRIFKLAVKTVKHRFTPRST